MSTVTESKSTRSFVYIRAPLLLTQQPSRHLHRNSVEVTAHCLSLTASLFHSFCVSGSREARERYEMRQGAGSVSLLYWPCVSTLQAADTWTAFQRKRTRSQLSSAERITRSTQSGAKQLVTAFIQTKTSKTFFHQSVVQRPRLLITLRNILGKCQNPYYNILYLPRLD